MSSSCKDLFDYDLVKNCSMCKNVCLKSFFHEDKSTKDELTSSCKECRNNKRRKYYNNNRNLEIDRRTKYRHNHWDENREYDRKRRLDPSIELIENQRSRFFYALKSNKKNIQMNI